MTCPSCHTPLESRARFCGVCGYRVGAPRQPEATPSGLPPPVLNPSGPRPAARPQVAAAPAARPPPAVSAAAKNGPSPARASIKREPQGDEIYLNQVLNNRFKVESKIGEGGFGAVYRGLQLATGRKVALKLLHPEMTKDENLVARFRREGMVLCNLRDAHTITTYDFDQTPDGTLYIAMELLEGKSLHQLFHEQAPLAWKRVFKILTEMCSSLAEAHARGIVHRDLKPENIYLESRSGNPEFVKILDFGIAKVMRGDAIDPQSPQLTATGQTLGTLEYMSPEQLMGKQLDGRSDVYALGVLAYEMITGRLPFPDAKGPAGLITAQLKHTPVAPSQACPSAGLPRAADRAILKCLEKDKTNRYPDVTALAAALHEAMAGPSAELEALQQLPVPGAHHGAAFGPDLLETRRGELPNLSPPSLPASTLPGAGTVPGDRGSGLAQPPRPGAPGPHAGHGPAGHSGHATPPVGAPFVHPMTPARYPGGPAPATHGRAPVAMQLGAQPPQARPAGVASSKLIWWVLALLVVGAGVGTVMALLLK
jgi:eukaryotic-like serine/threonine-protein kinase